MNLKRMRCLIVLQTFLIAHANTKSRSTTVPSFDEKPTLTGSKPDPWVSAAPLIVGAVCRDGVALVAIHPTPSNEGELRNSLKTSLNNTKCRTSEDIVVDEDSSLLLDWTTNYRDVLRIHPIDNVGTALLCCGWRTDGHWLAQACRRISREEVSTFGEPAPAFLAQEASLWMAQCTASDTVRPLSVVGLLASITPPQGVPSDDQGIMAESAASEIGQACLHLVDATGAYRVRAHAVGLGSKTINARLREIRFETMTAEEGVQQLLQVLRTQHGVEGDHDWHALDNATRIELAFVDVKSKRLQRIRQPFLITSRPQ